MADTLGTSGHDERARRDALIDAIPVVVLGAGALALGSSPADTAARQAAWLGLSALFVLGITWVLVRRVRRGDEYERKIQFESMAVAFGAVLVALQVAGTLAAAGVGRMDASFELIVIGGILLWQLLAALRMRSGR